MYYKMYHSFSFIISFVSTMNAMSIIKPISVNLQCRSYDIVKAYNEVKDVIEELRTLRRSDSMLHCKKKSVQCTPNMVCYVCPNWNTLYGVKSHHILGVCLTPNWVCFHTNSVCFPTNFSVFFHSL